MSIFTIQISKANPPDHLQASTHDISMNWVLFQNSSGIQNRTIGIGDFGCPVVQFGNEVAFGGNAAVAKYCFKSNWILLTHEKDTRERIVGAALISTIEVAAKSGYYQTRRTISCGDDCEKLEITNNYWSSKGSISAKDTQIYNRTKNETWLVVLGPQSNLIDPSSFWQNYQVHIYNHQSGNLLLTIPIDNSTLTIVGRMGNRMMVRDIGKEIVDGPTGVAIGQSFRIELITQGAFETPARDTQEKDFGSSLTWGILSNAQ